FNTYGPGQTLTPYVGVITIFINKLLKGEQPVIFGDGEQQRDFTHVDDIVSGTMATLAGPPGTYNLGTGKASSVNDIASMLIAHINPDITPLYAAEQVGELKISIADILKAQNNLNYSPSHDIASDIKSVIEHIKTR
ncbi:MAG: GDP-mannose 4,6-dehydratase, partial [Candidatus Brocadiales bacterium]|nr:GDP-mannose 4,6-dehydratase [Candidatus Brocadiales bacterium]